ncbi:MAG TPA: alpha/beta hydrolase [Anaerolinea sp.]|nr:alpha/beta hydrolase [Anaerolinea sp.]
MEQTHALPAKKVKAHISLKKALGWAAIFVAAACIIFYGVVGAISADQLTLPERAFNEKMTPAQVNLPYENIQFGSRDQKATIAAWYVPSEKNERAIILVHGRNASRTELFMGYSLDLIKALNQAGFSVLSLDLRGHGQSSDGRFTFGLKERYDVMGAVDWLAARGYQPGKIGVAGISLGSSAVIGASAEDTRIGALVSDSGFADIYPMIQSRWVEESGLPMFFLNSTRLMIWLKYGYDITASRPVDEIGKVAPRPILLIHCSDDALIPYANVLQLQAAAPGAQLWTIPSCIHGQSYNAEPAEYQTHLIEFFQSGLK